MPLGKAYAAALVSLIIQWPAFAQSQSDEAFKGKTVTIYVGNPVGGGYDFYGRLLARHIGRHLPGNPNVVATNLVGGQSITCANFLYSVAPRDGTAFGILNQNIAEEQVFDTPGARFDATRFTWIGRITSTVEVSYVWHTVPIHTIEDVKTRETIFAGGGPGSIIYQLLLNDMIGTRFKIVRGFPGTNAAHLALERGEVEGAASSLQTLRTSTPGWLKDNKVRIILQHALERSPELPNVPAVVELGKTPQDRTILSFFAGASIVGRSFVAPPDLPPDRVGMLRAAFDATMKDPLFLADARKTNADVNPLPGSELQEIMARGVTLPAGERARAKLFRWR